MVCHVVWPTAVWFCGVCASFSPTESFTCQSHVSKSLAQPLMLYMRLTLRLLVCREQSGWTTSTCSASSPSCPSSCWRPSLFWWKASSSRLLPCKPWASPTPQQLSRRRFWRDSASMPINRYMLACIWIVDCLGNKFVAMLFLPATVSEQQIASLSCTLALAWTGVC